MQTEIKNLIAAKVLSLFPEIVLNNDSVELSFPENVSLGHLSTNIAMKLAKQLQVNPRDLAGQIQSVLSESSEVFTKVEVAGPGFINLFLNSEVFLKLTNDLLSNADNLSKSNVGAGQHYVVEYSSPNIAKPFSIGHLRSTIIGDAIANLLESQGYTVYRDNHLGDWGSQFGKLTYAIQQWSSVEELEKSEDVIADLLNLYVKYHELEATDENVKKGGRENFKKLEEGDPEIKALWQKCIDWSFAYFDKIYKKLKVKDFTENGGKGYGESFFEDKMPAVLVELTEKLPNNYKFNDGAWLVFFEKQTKLPPLMILKSDGSTLYATRDLATDKFRIGQYPAGTKIINEIGSEQSLYMRQLYETEKMLGWFKDGERVHVKHGLYRLPEGKMSTRKGNVIWVEEVIDEAIERAKTIAKQSDIIEDVDKVAEIVGIGAVKFNDLKRNSELDIVFDWEEVLALKGFSGPYIQYMYARCASILRKAEITNSVDIKLSTTNLELHTLEEQQLLLLSKFKQIVSKSAAEYMPSILCNYLYDVAQQFSKLYAELPVLQAEAAQKELRIAITYLTANTIKQGLNLLGIETLEQM